MKLIRLFFFASVILFLTSCTTETQDCICTEEFRTITVLVLDQGNKPVEGLTTTVANEKGIIYNLPDNSTLPGYYIVMSDKYVLDFSTVAEKILFAGISDSGSVNGEYYINTDRCKCHIQKISGPDTLVLK
jgi:hypothetical protein